MMSLQMWMLAGAVAMGGVAALVWRLVPAQPDLGDVVRLLSPSKHAARTATAETVSGLEASDRLGLWAMQHLPSRWLGRPDKDLAILGKTSYSYVGEKVLLFGVGLVAGPVLSALFVYAFNLPLAVPVAATIAAAIGLWFVPNGEVKKRAREARLEFSRAICTYVDLVALERRAGGSGTRQALENAAQVGGSWPFRRIADALTRSRFSGVPPWDALHGLADELGLPDLDDLADIMRLSGEEGAQVYESLRARSTALRHSLLSAEHTRANEVAQRMLLPSTATGLIFAVIVITPSIMRLLAG
jgi:Flp pilus assembly protein TadB